MRLQDKLAEQREVLLRVKNLIADDKVYSVSELSVNELDQPVWVLGAGKGAAELARSFIRENKLKVKDGIIISNRREKPIPNVQLFSGGHPFPNEDSVAASHELLLLARRIPTGARVYFFLTGGASALLCLPPDSIEIEELQETYDLLLKSGADIRQMNIVRKHLDVLKGGQLAQVLRNQELITIVSSDVPGNDLETIGSAPTYYDSSTFDDSITVLKNYHLWGALPSSVRGYLLNGAEGKNPETVKPGASFLNRHQVVLSGQNESLLEQIAQLLEKNGYHPKIDDSHYSGDVKQVSKMMCSTAISVLSEQNEIKKPVALIFNGESSINVNGDGKGGRNQHLALMMALSLEGQHTVSILSMGTDGIDGNTEVAGALVSSNTTLMARKQKIEPEPFLQNFDSYHFHEAMNTSIKTGPTGKNLMDIQVILIG
jgi:glycerate-2-kinase